MNCSRQAFHMVQGGPLSNWQDGPWTEIKQGCAEESLPYFSFSQWVNSEKLQEGLHCCHQSQPSSRSGWKDCISKKKKKRGKPVKFGKYDEQNSMYLRAIRKAGGKVNRTFVQGAAFGILHQKAPHLLHGVNVRTRAWCNSILKCIRFVKHKGTKQQRRYLQIQLNNKEGTWTEFIIPW